MQRILIVLFSIHLLVSNCSNSEEVSYTQKILVERKFKSQGFFGANSPLTKEQKKIFKGLDYFSVDTNFRVNAKIHWLDKASPIQLYSDTNQSLKYVVGNVKFNLNNKAFTLLSISNKPGKNKELFIPFLDKTNGKTTYGGGRYLDVVTTDLENVELDFNMAYNPYCAYNSDFVCPVPPNENYIDVNIFAGEKIPLIEKHSH